MKIRRICTLFLVFALMLAGTVSAVSADKNRGYKGDKLEIDPLAEDFLNAKYAPSGDSGVEVAKIKVSVGDGVYDNIIITNYVQIDGDIGNEATVLFTGQSLAADFYKDLCVYLAQQGKNVYVIDRREVNVPASETDLTFMENWTVEKTLDDYSKGIRFVRYHVAGLNGSHVSHVKVAGIGHSLGGTLMTAYSGNSASGRLDKRVIVDTIPLYNPAETDLIEGQRAYCQEVRASMAEGVYYADNMKNMIGLGGLALQSPDEICFMQPVPGYSLTNLQVFRIAAGMTYANMDYPYTPNYHYWTMDSSYMWGVPLSYVDEQALLQNVVMEGGAVPYSPSSLDLHMSELMIGDKRINPRNLKNAEYIGFEGGFGYYGEYAFIQAGRPTQVIEKVGHGAIFSSEEVQKAIAVSVE